MTPLDLPFSVPHTLMGEIAARVCARLGVPCDPAAAAAQHSYVSAATNSMTDLATADFYEGRIAGLPGSAVLTLSGRERLWQWAVEGGAGAGAAREALGGALWDVLRAHTRWVEHPANPAEWTERARSIDALSLELGPSIFPRRTLRGEAGGCGFGLVRGGELGEREGTPWLLALGPLPSGSAETMLRALTAPEAPLPPLERLLSALDPQAPVPRPRVSEKRELHERTPLLFGWDTCFADEQVSSWTAGPWLLRETRLFHWSSTGPVPGEVCWAIQRDDGQGPALMLRSSCSRDQRETWGPVLGEAEAAQRAGRRVEEVLAG